MSHHDLHCHSERNEESPPVVIASRDHSFRSEEDSTSRLLMRITTGGTMEQQGVKLCKKCGAKIKQKRKNVCPKCDANQHNSRSQVAKGLMEAVAILRRHAA